MISATLQIPFKGSRDYLQGPDIFDWVLSYLNDANAGPLDVFEISFHSMAIKPLELSVREVPRGGKPTATGYYVGTEGKVRFWLTETNGKIEGRVPYSEEELVACLHYFDNDNEVELAKGVGFSDIETWVSMTKALHHKMFPEATGKWVFARAKLNAYTSDRIMAKYRVKLASKLGHKLTRNEIYLNDVKVGDIFFSLM